MSRKVLLIDDDPVVRILLTEYLGALGYEVECSENGVEARAALQDPSGRPDIILLDMILPDTDGPALTEFARSLPDLSKVPIVLLSANSPADALDMARQRGISIEHYLQKPFDLRSLENVLSSLNAHSPRSRENSESTAEQKV